MDKRFGEFLLRNSVVGANALPLVHSTPAYHLRSFQTNNLLQATPCDVFVGENLNYFFVGRPAYKFRTEAREAEYWEYPCCFIFDFSAVQDVRRIFPFDSGAFHRKKYPKYINMMDKNVFEVADVAGATGKIIGAFFGSASRYFQLQSKSRDAFIGEYSLNVMDAELKALHKLSTETNAMSFDDRRFTIEVQSSSELDLTVTRPLAVVAPSDYFENADFRRHVIETWQAEPISYPIYPLSVANCYGQIYERVFEFYKSRHLL